MNIFNFDSILALLPFKEAADEVLSYRHSISDIENIAQIHPLCFTISKYFIKRDEKRHIVFDIGLEPSNWARRFRFVSGHLVDEEVVVFFREVVDTIRAHLETIATITVERDILETVKTVKTVPYYQYSSSNGLGIPTLVGRRVIATTPFLEATLDACLDYSIPVIFRLVASDSCHHFEEDVLEMPDPLQATMPWDVVVNQSSLEIPPYYNQ